jgi:hypothetical protein
MTIILIDNVYLEGCVARITLVIMIYGGVAGQYLNSIRTLISWLRVLLGFGYDMIIQYINRTILDIIWIVC